MELGNSSPERGITNPAEETTRGRVSARRKAEEIVALLRDESPDYFYLRNVFRHVREALGIEVPAAERPARDVPSVEELSQFLRAVYASKREGDRLLIQTFLYTGIRVSELIALRCEDIASADGELHIGGRRARVIALTPAFAERLGEHARQAEALGATHLFESSRKRPYTERGIRKLFQRYTETAGLREPISPLKLRTFLLAWLRAQGLEDGIILPVSGHATARSLEPFEKGAPTRRTSSYRSAMKRFPL